MLTSWLRSSPAFWNSVIICGLHRSAPPLSYYIWNSGHTLWDTSRTSLSMASLAMVIIEGFSVMLMPVVTVTEADKQ